MQSNAPDNRFAQPSRTRRLYRWLTALPGLGPLFALPLSLYRLPALMVRVEDLKAQLEATDQRLRREAGRSFPEDTYQFLQEQFRGPQDAIEKRLANYLPLLEELPPAPWLWPVVDLGCGRGEWVALLTRRGIPVRGFDSSAEAVAACRQQQLDVEQVDVLDRLRELPDDLLPAITAFQLIEHLTPPVLAELLQECFRVLRPGGLLLVETPNPENFQVGSYYFRLDPTHVQPLPPPLTAYLLHALGFRDIRVLRPEDYQPPIFEDPRLNRFFCVAMDYAVAARKPAAPDDPAPDDHAD